MLNDNTKCVLGMGTYAKVFASRKNPKECKKVTCRKSREGIPRSFIMEAAILRLLKDADHVVRCGKISIGNKCCLYLERYENDLHSLGCVSEIQAKNIIFKLLIALHNIHEKGIIHGDVAPKNVLIKNSVDVALCDWGLSQIVQCNDKSLTSYVQSLWWKSPEALLGDDHYTDKIDIWSCGLIMLHLLQKIDYLKGNSDEEQLILIFKTFGTPDEGSWSNISKLPNWTKVPRHTEQTFNTFVPVNTLVPGGTSDEYINLLSKMLKLCPNDRISAREALMDPYFSEFPKPKLEPDMNDYLQNRQVDRSCPKFVLGCCTEILIELILSINMKLQNNFENYFLSILLLELFCKKSDNFPHDLKLYGVASLLLSCELNDEFPIESTDLVYSTDMIEEAEIRLYNDNVYTTDMIEEAEIRIFKTLDYDIIFPTEYTCLCTLCIKFGDHLIKMKAAILLAIGTLSSNLRIYTSFDLAFSALVVVLSAHSETCGLYIEQIKSRYAEKLRDEKILFIMEHLNDLSIKSYDNEKYPILYAARESATKLAK